MTRTFTLRGLRLADAADLARLERAQQLRLELERQLADLVEEHRAAVGRLEGAGAVAVGAGEGAAHVAEELALDEVRADRAAVDDDERLVRARAALDDLGRDELLAGAALAVDEHVDVARGDLSSSANSLRIGRLVPTSAPNDGSIGTTSSFCGAPERTRTIESPSESTPSVPRSPSRSTHAVERVPFIEPESRERQTPSSRTMRQWKRETVGSSRTRSFDACEPIRQTSPSCTTARWRADAAFALDLQREARDRDGLDELADRVDGLRGRAHSSRRAALGRRARCRLP